MTTNGSPFRGKANNSGGEAFEVPPEDNHVGVLVGIIDLGSHQETYQDGNSKLARKVRLVWELPLCKKSGSNMSHTIGKDYTLSFNAKAALRKLMECLRKDGGKFKENEEMDVMAILGKACLVNVVRTSKEDRTYANIENITRLPSGTPAPKADRTPLAWFIGCGDEIPEGAWIPRVYGNLAKDLIESSAEWREIMRQGREEDEPAMAGAADDSTPF